MDADRADNTAFVYRPDIRNNSRPPLSNDHKQWSSWSSDRDQWSSWSSDSESSSTYRPGIPWLPVILTIVVVALGGFLACGIVLKRGARKRSQRQQQAADCRRQIPLTDVELRQPRPHSMPPSVPLWPSEGTNRAQPSAPELDQTPPSASPTPGTVDTTLPPPSYNDVMKYYIRS